MRLRTNTNREELILVRWNYGTGSKVASANTVYEVNSSIHNIGDRLYRFEDEDLQISFVLHYTSPCFFRCAFLSSVIQQFVLSS